MKYTSELMKAVIYPYEGYVFFWAGPFSQWADGKFICTSLNEEVNCAEQAMMLHKAKMFNDMETYELIKNTSHPRDQKALGRMVKNFDKHKWDVFCLDIVTNINVDKFRHAKAWKELLYLTHPHLLVEASPNDMIWGIGMGVDNPNLLDTSIWGSNYLGRTLTTARSILMIEDKC